MLRYVVRWHCRENKQYFWKKLFFDPYFANFFQDKNIILAEVDATVEKSLATEHGVSGYPTLFIFRNGKKFEYTGPRDAEGIYCNRYNLKWDHFV